MGIKAVFEKEINRWDEFTSRPKARKALIAFFAVWTAILVAVAIWMGFVLVENAAQDYISLKVAEKRLAEKIDEPFAIQASLSDEETLHVHMQVGENPKGVSAFLWEPSWDLVAGEFFVKEGLVDSFYESYLLGKGEK